MIVRDKYNNYVVQCDNCPRQHTPQPTVSAARSAAKRGGWAERDGRDLCPWCKSEALLAEHWVETGR